MHSRRYITIYLQGMNVTFHKVVYRHYLGEVAEVSCHMCPVARAPKYFDGHQFSPWVYSVMMSYIRSPPQMSCAPRINGPMSHKPISPYFLSGTPHCLRPHFHDVVFHVLQMC